MEEQLFRFSGDLCDYTEPASAKLAKTLLGGKGAGLVMMAQMGLNVPPGFTIPTPYCKAYMALSPKLREEFIDKLMTDVCGCMGWLEGKFGYMPLVSVRSGAPVSMPGMMDTILNVGLTADNTLEWNKRIGDRATADSVRRLIQMLGSTGYGVPMEVFDFQLAAAKKEFGAKQDTDLNASQLWAVAERYLKAFKANKNLEFPVNDSYVQLRTAIKAVFDSWMNPRAIEYRKINKLSDDMGTAVNVQAMVFGNMGDTSGSGVLFTRNPSTGEPGMMGEFLINAQGEDVVAGIRTPWNVWDMNTVEMQDTVWPDIYQQLVKVSADLENSYEDMVDIEFTVQKEELFILQSRTGKRSARAAFRIAFDLVNEGVINRTRALSRLTGEQFKAVRRPMISPAFKTPPHFTGLPACPGVAVGRPVFSAKEAVEATEPVILVTHETNPDDIAGMAKAVGILTQTGGATSHAAVVARAMDKPCVVGCTDLTIDKQLIGGMKTGGVLLTNADVTIDGATGNVWVGIDVPVIDASDDPEVRAVMGWCLEEMHGVEVSPVGRGMDKPHCVAAAYWWGSEEVLDAVLSGLEQLPDRGHILFNCDPPVAIAPPIDALLTTCFGLELGDQFHQAIYAELINRAEKLKGLRVAGLPAKSGQLVALGYSLGWNSGQTPVILMPADYAVFTALRR